MQNFAIKSTKNNIFKTMKTRLYKVILVNANNPSETKEIEELASSATLAAFGAEMENPGYICSEAYAC